MVTQLAWERWDLSRMHRGASFDCSRTHTPDEACAAPICESSKESLATLGRSSAWDCFNAAKAFDFELISTQRLKRAARASIRTSGIGCALLDIAFNAEM
jgi:hypothetical protein